MSTPTDRPDVSVVLEHETAGRVSVERAGALARQMREAPFTVEILIPEQADIDIDDLPGVFVRRFDVPSEAHYYDIKNAGARAAQGRLIVFVDADVVPLDGWLVNLVKPFADPAVEVVLGHTMIRPASSVSEKTFAAGTWFPAHEDDVRLQIMANNVAIRPERFLPAGFPEAGCRYRGPCRDLDHAWAALGVRMDVAMDARVVHPPPEHLVRRALWDGHDQQIEQRAAGSAFAPRLARVVLHQLLIGSVRILRNRRTVGLNPAQLPFALACNVREALARGSGFILARFGHDVMHRRIPT